MAEISGFRIASIDFVNASVGFACGNNKGIYKTTDGGSNWHQMNTVHIDLTPTLNEIKAASADVIYAVGSFGSIIKSIDGGENWYNIYPYHVHLKTFNDKMVETQMATFESIICFTPEKIMVSGYISFERIGIILKSDDAGEFWNEEKVITGVKPRIMKIAKNASGGIIAAGDEGVILSKSPEDKFEWSPATGLSDANIPDPIAMSYSTTNYTVTRTSGNCTATDELTVYVTTSSENKKTINCGQGVLLDKVPYPGNFTGNVLYKWTPATGLNSDTIAQPFCTATEATQYTGMAILNDGVYFIDSVFTQKQFVVVNSFDINAGDDIYTVCGSDVALQVQHNFPTGEHVSYKWYPADGLDDDTKQNPIATVSGSITYTVAVTTASGCVAYDDVHIIANAFQPVTFSKNVSLSCGSSVVLDSIGTNYSGSGKLSYKWSPTAGLNSDTIANPVCSANTNTTYKVAITTPAGNSTSANVIVQVVPIQINAGSNKSFYCGEQVQLDSVTTNYSGTGLKYKWTPSTGLSNDTIPNPIVTSEDTRTYTITVSTPGACSASKTITVTKLAVPTPSITGVSVDGQHKNHILWEAPEYEHDSIFIYKETSQFNQYKKIGTVERNINSFSDTLSQPKVMSSSYKISLLDRCGTETAMSQKHKTMHLAINKGVSNSWNLIWESYIGFEVATYYIYRGTTDSQLTLISSLSGSNTQFSDFTAPAGDVFYQIEAVKAVVTNIISIDGRTKSNAFTSRSNIAAYLENVGLITPSDISNEIELLPNPAKNYLEVWTKTYSGSPLTLTIYNLQGVAMKKTEVLSPKQGIDISDLAPGMYMLVLEDAFSKGSKKLMVR